ncbi:TIGR01906 family membrane protein [Liquorilactobacillus capillatus]|nr:TIGR01906 family membrane protein [Liquorilactobacillus capillatus]
MIKGVFFKAFKWSCLFICLISLSVILTIGFTPLYHFFVYQDNLGKSVGLSNKQLMYEYYHLLAFLNFPWVDQLKLSLEMSYNGLSHFQDVKRLFLLNHLLFIATLPVSIVFLLKMKREKKLWHMIRPFKAGMALFFVVAAVMVLQFNTFFVAFHRLLFRNNNWLFDPKLDPIINALPDTFFMACFGAFFLLVELFLTVGIWGGYRSLRRKI